MNAFMYASKAHLSFAIIITLLVSMIHMLIKMVGIKCLPLIFIRH